MMLGTKNKQQAPMSGFNTGRPLKITLLFWLLALFGPLALVQSGAIVALLFALTVVGLWGRIDRQAFFAADDIGKWCLLALLVYSLLSVAWARDSQEAFYDWWRVALILASGWILGTCVSRLCAAHSRYLLQGLLWGAALLLIVLSIEWVTKGQLAAFVKKTDTSHLSYTSRACAVLAVLLWPLALFCHQRLGAVAAGAVLISTLILIAVLPMLAASAGVIVATVVFLCHCVWPRFVFRAFGFVIITMVLAAPWAGIHISRYVQSDQQLIVYEDLPSSWLHRLVIWEFFAERIQASPWRGYGLGSAHGLGEVPAALEHYRQNTQPYGNAIITAQPPLHPHNAALQLWHDLGIVGVLVAGGWLFFMLRNMTRHDAAKQAAAASLASLTAWLVIAALSFGLWQKWWLASGGITVAVCMLLLRGLETQGRDANA